MRTLFAGVVLVVAVICVVAGSLEISPPRNSEGFPTDIPDLGAAIRWWVFPALVAIALVVGIVLTISDRRKNAGRDPGEIEAERALTRAKFAGYVKVAATEPHCTQCPTPRFTGQKASVRVGIGSIWQCHRCGRRWILEAHEHEVNERKTTLSKWRLAPRNG